jgi:hypothetical protein
VIAFNPMLRAGYDVKLASGVITAGGTLGIMIPPSVMIIVYAAVAGQSVVKLYAAAMFPGFFPSFLYLVYIIGWALIDPKIAPPLPEEQTRVKVPALITAFQRLYSPNMAVALTKALVSPVQAKGLEIDGRPMTYARILQNFVIALVPFLLTFLTLATVWWYVVIHQQAAASAGPIEGLQQLGSAASAPAETPAEKGPDFQFYLWFWISAAVLALWTARSYRRMDGERFEWTEIIIIFVPIFSADAEAFPHRLDPVGHPGVREPAGRLPFAAGRDVGVLTERRRAKTRDAEPDLCRHDALYADRHRLHGDHVSVARHDAVAAGLSVRRVNPCPGRGAALLQRCIVRNRDP